VKRSQKRGGCLGSRKSRGGVEERDREAVPPRGKVRLGFLPPITVLLHEEGTGGRAYIEKSGGA